MRYNSVFVSKTIEHVTITCNYKTITRNKHILRFCMNVLK